MVTFVIMKKSEVNLKGIRVFLEVQTELILSPKRKKIGKRSKWRGKSVKIWGDFFFS